MLKNKKIFLLSNNYKSLVINFLMFTYCLSSFAQISDDNQIKRLQRAIFVYNFAQQVNWSNHQDFSDFTIGVLGSDPVFLDFKSLAKKRQIKNKTVKVIDLKSVKEVRDIQLLYVNKNYNYDINYLLSKIEGKNILLVTENYNYNTSMINMINIGDSFGYEINSSILKREKFTTANSLKKYAVSSSEKWKHLYKKTETILGETKQKEAKQKALIKSKEAEILSQKQTINTQEVAIDTILSRVLIKDKRIQNLSNQRELQNKKYEDKVKIEKELEESIKQQIEFIKSQKEDIIHSDKKIKEQLGFIQNQNSEIAKKERILKEKNSKISTQKTINILLITFILFGLIVGCFLYKIYLEKKKLNQKLAISNIAIKKQSQVLESKNNELEQFAYIASHDLKEPLITISSLIELLVDDYKDKLDDDGRTSLNYIQESSTRMQKLIDAILQYSRLGKSKTTLNVDCNSIIDILKGDLKNVIERTNTIINYSKLPTVKGAELELRLLFQNLISNGIKFTKNDVAPIISIDAKKKSNFNLGLHWEFSITDNGIGIPEKHQQRIFAIFQRLHSREEYEGTGIGLAHCKKIVEAHGGKIWLKSEVDKGTTFFFTIPVKA